jgi:hypothetical protein
MLHYLRSYPSQSQVDFDTRWNNTKPNTIPVIDNHTPIHSPRHTQLAQRAHLQAKSEFDSGVDLEIRTMTEETCTPATISPQHSVTSEELFQPPTKKSASLTNLQVCCWEITAIHPWDITVLYCNFAKIKYFHLTITNRKGCWWWHLMEHVHNNLMKLG